MRKDSICYARISHIHWGDASLRTLSLVLIAAAAAMSVPGFAQAADFTDDHCTVTVPADWKMSKTRASSPDKKVWVELLSAPTAAEIVQTEVGLGGKSLPDEGGKTVLVTSASFGGLTNKAYIIVTKGAPACMAQGAAPAGDREALAKQVALTVRVAR
jgi:hypothetical protein